MTMNQIDPIVEIDHRTTIEMTIEKGIIRKIKVGNNKIGIQVIMKM